MNCLFSEDRRFRYWLLREWDISKPVVAFIGLNPSTADETQDDPTVRRVIGFAKLWGYGSVLMLNLYSYRATDPRKLWDAHRTGVDIVGGVRGFRQSLEEYAFKHKAQKIVACWGNDLTERWRLYHNSLWDLDCLKKNKNGQPGHPLYLRGDLGSMPWNYEAIQGGVPPCI